MPDTVIYFVAIRPDIVKALGDTIYHDPQEAQEVAMFLQATGPWRVWRAIVTEVKPCPKP